MAGKQVFIHAGAHRTGTSSFQLCMAQNRAVLAAAGLDAAYPGRDGAPGGQLKLRLPQPRHGPRKFPEFEAMCRRVFEQHSPDPQRNLVLSEENLPGRMMHFHDGQFFPAVRKRFDLLARALPGQVAHLLYVVRPYDEVFVSAYRKRAEDNPVPPFAEVAGNMVSFDGGWSETVVAMRDALAPARLTVIDYAKRGQSRELLARLVGVDVASLAEPARSLNVSATDAALIALQARYHSGESLRRREWQQVIRDHAEDRRDQGLAGFSADQAARLRARYVADLSALAAMPGVELIA